MRRGWLALLSVMLIGAQASASPRARTVIVSAGQLFSVADAALAKGDETLARKVLKALMTDRFQDVRLEARFRLALIKENHRNWTAAAVLLRQIVDERPNASRARLELAGVLDKMGDREGAWRQVRAIRSGNLPPAVARLVDRYSEALRARRPVGASIEIAVAPDTNINRATRSTTLGTVLGDFDIADAGKAKSGVGLSLHGQAYRRVPLAPKVNLLARASGLANLYGRKAFNDIAADIAAGPEFDLGRDSLQLELGVTQRWYGQKPFIRSARLGGTMSHAIGSRTALRFSGSAALVDNRMSDLQDGKDYTASLSLERALSPTAGVVATASLSREAVQDPGYSTIGWRAGLTGWRDLGRATATASVEAGNLHADERLLLFPERREDHYRRLSVGATFRQLQVHGFAPVFRFSIERNRSTIAFYDYRRTRAEFGIARAF